MVMRSKMLQAFFVIIVDQVDAYKLEGKSLKIKPTSSGGDDNKT